MAEATVRDALDGVIKNIGFGIVADFRELGDAMREISSDMRNNNRLLEQTNENISDTNKTLTDFEKSTQRAREFRLNRSTEDRLERRSRINGQRSEEMMQRILASIEELQRQVKMGAQGGDEGEGGGLLGSIFGGATAGAAMRGAARIGKIGAVVGAVAAVGAVGAYLMGAGQSEGSEGGSLSPGSDASSGGTPNVAGDALAMGAGVVASTAAGPAAQAILDRTTKTARQKALAKIAPKVPSYLSKFGGRIATIIGLKSIPVFGALVGGYFSFSRFMSGDSWTSIGAEFVSGVAPDAGALVGGPVGYVAGVATTLSIQTYLICRDIYQEENAIDIKNGIVPNFDDLDVSEKTQVVKAVGAYVESYVNSLLGRSSTADSTTGIKTDLAAGAGLAGAGAALPVSGAQPGAAPGAPPTTDSGSGGVPQTPPTTESSGATTQAAADIASNRLATENAGGPTSSESAYTAPDSYAGGIVPSNESQDNEQTGASPSDTMATLSTSSDLAGGFGDINTLKAEIASGEGDYGAYNRGTAGDTKTREIDIQNLSVGQVMELQNQGKLFAVGKYQFIPGTLREAVQYTGIDPNQPFNASTQEQLFPYLISEAKRPTLAGYLAGRHNDVDAALNDLAAEFASIPQSNGRGRHDGDSAGNRASGGQQRAQKIKRILEGVRNSNLGSTSGGTESVAPMAEGATITPLSADKPKAGRDLSAALSPPKVEDGYSDEEKFTSSQQGMDLRNKKAPSGAIKEKVRNSISSYSDYMEFMFGAMPKEMMDHVNGEVTADKAFKDAMNPLI